MAANLKVKVDYEKVKVDFKKVKVNYQNHHGSVHPGRAAKPDEGNEMSDGSDGEVLLVHWT